MQYPVRRSLLARWLAAAALTFAGAIASAQTAEPAADPPARVGTLSELAGSVVFAPAGETEWSEAQRNRPITRGDRLWTDEGARAEVHFGSSAVHMDGRTFLEVVAVDSDAVQLQLNEGTANARVRELQGGENFEIDTPNLAFRATQPGDWRIDVDPQRGFTRVVVHSGTAVVYGAGGGVQQVVAGQTMAFAGRDLAQLSNLPAVNDDGFERWAADRNRAEDQSIAARYIPREVVGYQELDRNGTWSQDATYGTVWYPNVTVADWAPYRYGRWSWVEPWGWTWIDDAPWGFAPFHYGRWAMIGARWCWVPGPIGPRPVYAPALVAFVGGSNFNISVSNGPGVAWYPLAPGEVWRPFFNASPRYARGVNRYVVSDSRYYNNGTPRFMHRPEAITAVRVDDFHRGRPVQRNWTRVNPFDVARVQPVMPPAPAHDLRRIERDRAPGVVHAPRSDWQPRVQRYAQPIPSAEPRREFFQPRQQMQPQPQVQPQQQPSWRNRDEQSRVMREQQREQQRQAFVQQHQQQQQVQQQRVEAMRQQQWHAQQRQAFVQQQQQHQQQFQQQEQRREQHEQRRVQREAQREDDGHGRGHGRRWE